MHSQAKLLPFISLIFYNFNVFYLNDYFLSYIDKCWIYINGILMRYMYQKSFLCKSIKMKDDIHILELEKDTLIHCLQAGIFLENIK